MPKVLGNDEQGRQILQWIEGNAGLDEVVRPEVQSDALLEEAARLIRQLHDASSNFQWDEGGWDTLLVDPSASQEIICHNDIGPANLIYRDGQPIALVDWEFAAPGSRLWDLAYAAWWLVPLHRPEFCQRIGWRDVDQLRRLRHFCDAYGLEHRRDRLMDVIHERQLRNQQQLAKWVAEGVIQPFDSNDPTVEGGRTDYVDGRRAEFEKALLE